jgi:type I restriction enzyme, S subunit
MNLIKVKDFADVATGGTPSTKRDDFWVGGEIPWLNSGELNQDIITTSKNFITKEGLNNSSTRMMPPDTVLIALTGATTGKVGYLTFEACANQSVTGILPSLNHVPKYVYYYLNSIRSKVLDDAYGGAQPHISQGYVKNINIPLPPIGEQKQITAILDAADELRQKDKALIAKYDELTQSLFLNMFGDPVTNPKGWDEIKLSEVCQKITDGTHHSPEPQSEGFPYVTAKHVKAFHLAFDSKPTFVNGDAHREIYKRCSPEFGDVLYIKDGATTGVACLNTFEQPISLLSSLALIKTSRDKLNPQYLIHWLNHSGVKEKLISQFMSGAAIQRYTLKKISSFILPVPGISLQDKFASYIQVIETQRIVASKSLYKSESLFGSLLQKAFKGELTN